MPRLVVQIVRRGHLSPARKLALVVVAVAVAIILSGLLVAPLGVDPAEFYYCFLTGSLLDLRSLVETLSYLVPITLCCLSAIVAFRAGLWNIGQDGQFIIGAVASLGLAVFLLPAAPPVLAPVLAVIVGGLAGAFWALIPGILRAVTEANEAVTTLMLMYVAQEILRYVCYGPWKDPRVKGFPQTYSVPDQYQLGLVEYLLAMAVIVVGVYLMLEKTKFRVILSLLLEGTRVATYAGVPVKKYICIVMAMSGFLAGCAGSLYLIYAMHLLEPTYVYWFGFAGIIAAWLCELKPLFAVAASFLLAMIHSSYYTMQIRLGLSASTVEAIEGILLICVLLVHFFTRYKVQIRLVH